MNAESATCLAPFLSVMKEGALQPCSKVQTAVAFVPQHPPVFTLGKRGTDEDVLTGPEQMRRLGADVHRSARGGQATFHGPGQVARRVRLLFLLCRNVIGFVFHVTYLR